MHMALAQRLIADPSLSGSARDLLRAAWGAFLLGSIAPDARVSSGISRVDTHFFEYSPVVDPPPALALLARHSELKRTALHDPQQTAFVAGYVAHLAMDEIWCTELLFPNFIQQNWGPSAARNLSLHVLLGYLDDRDRQKLPESDYDQLASVVPHGWLPFMSDAALAGWRDVVASQIAPGATSQTFDILGKRVGMPGADLAVLSRNEMNAKVWSNIPPARIASVEESMYNATRETVIAYIDSSL